MVASSLVGEVAPQIREFLNRLNKIDFIEKRLFVTRSICHLQIP